MKRLIAVFFVVLSLTAQVYALTINPSMATREDYDLRDSASFSGFTLHGPWYVCDVGTGERSGYLFIDDYETVFSPLTEPSGATISYTGGPKKLYPIASWIAVTGVDVGSTPAWYLIPLHGWNGTDDLFLSGFWPGQGSIDSVAFYTPEPASFFLLGTGMIGIAVYVRRKQSKDF